MIRRGSRKGRGKNKGNHLHNENLLLSAFFGKRDIRFFNKTNKLVVIVYQNKTQICIVALFHYSLFCCLLNSYQSIQRGAIGTERRW